MTEIKCTDCGKTATVPFKPIVGKPVYCKTCFSKHIVKRPENAAATFSSDSKQAWACARDNWKGRKAKEHISIFRQP